LIPHAISIMFPMRRGRYRSRWPCRIPWDSVGTMPAWRCGAGAVHKEFFAMPTIHLRNNVAVRLRAAHGRDHERLRRMFYTLSDDTRYRYFGVGAPATADWAERLAALGRPAPDAYA